MGMRKIVINACYGGFSLSREAYLRLRELGHPEALAEPDVGEFWADGSGPRSKWTRNSYLSSISRDDPFLISVLETLGEEACSGASASLKIVQIPFDVDWQIEEYDGFEHVAEKHRTWF